MSTISKETATDGILLCWNIGSWPSRNPPKPKEGHINTHMLTVKKTLVIYSLVHNKCHVLFIVIVGVNNIVLLH